MPAPEPTDVPLSNLQDSDGGKDARIDIAEISKPPALGYERSAGMHCIVKYENVAVHVDIHHLVSSVVSHEVVSNSHPTQYRFVVFEGFVTTGSVDSKGDGMVGRLWRAEAVVVLVAVEIVSGDVAANSCFEFDSSAVWKGLSPNCQLELHGKFGK